MLDANYAQSDFNRHQCLSFSIDIVLCRVIEGALPCLVSTVRPCPCCSRGVSILGTTQGLLLLLIEERTMLGYHLQVSEGAFYG